MSSQTADDKMLVYGCKMMVQQLHTRDELLHVGNFNCKEKWKDEGP